MTMTCHPPQQRSSSSSSAATTTTTCGEYYDKTKSRKLPQWVKANIRTWDGVRICMPEWDDDESIASDDGDDDEVVMVATRGENGEIDRSTTEDELKDEYRRRNGWKGTDLCHSARHSPVRISHYTVKYSNNYRHQELERGGVGTILTGLCHFTQQSESHTGFCHGGSMTAAIDDVIGWTAFHVLGTCEPWSGHTVQVNVTLKRPIPLGSYMKIVGEVIRFEGRKVWVHASLFGMRKKDEQDNEDQNEDVSHSDADGLVLLKKDLVASSPT